MCKIITGSEFVDQRGKVRFVNEFHFKDIKRFYIIEHFSTEIIRAWQAHKIEKKYFFVISGSFLVCTVKIDNWNNPSPNLSVKKFVLTEKENKLLFIPNGYANGLKALETGSKIIVFSNLDFESAKKDNYRFPYNYWCDWNNTIGE